MLFGTALLLPSCAEINQKIGLKDDNALENGIEEVIKEKTGIEVDFTPEDKK